VIALRTSSGWQGRYCHFDGYPTGILPPLAHLWRQSTGAIRELLERDPHDLRFLELRDGRVYSEHYEDGKTDWWVPGDLNRPTLVEWLYVVDEHDGSVEVAAVRGKPKKGCSYSLAVITDEQIKATDSENA
jgi:hypothetical protein